MAAGWRFPAGHHSKFSARRKKVTKQAMRFLTVRSAGEPERTMGARWAWVISSKGSFPQGLRAARLRMARTGRTVSEG